MFSFVGNLKFFIMEANQCRLNNIVNYRGQITTLTKNEMVHFYRFSEFYEPIPLTEEILLKCGFEKGSNIIGDCYYIEHDFGVSDFVLNITKTSNFEIYELDLKIDYLHQLQNLYFALTNEELTVNL